MVGNDSCSETFCGPEKDRCCTSWFATTTGTHRLLRAGVLGDGLRALGHGVLGQLTRKQQTDGGLDFARRDRRALVVVRQPGRFGGDALEDVVHEAVHDAHRLRRDASVRVDLLQHLVDVDCIAFLAGLALLLLVRLGDVFLGLARLLRCLSASFRCHRD